MSVVPAAYNVNLLKLLRGQLLDVPYYAEAFVRSFKGPPRADGSPMASRDTSHALSGAIDVFPWSNLQAPPVGTWYHCRPVFQSYVAATPRLAELNAAFLRRDDAPATLLWRIEQTDNHWPSMEDALAWREVLARYRLAGRFQDHLILVRQPARQTNMQTVSERETNIGEWIDVPAGDGKLIWLQATLAPTLIGTLQALAYKPQDMVLEAELVDGSRQSRRLFPAMCSCGFLISPYIANTSQFEALISGDPGRQLDSTRLRRIRIKSAADGAVYGYKLQLMYRFSTLEFHSS
jgi:hypothetical protein